MPHKRNPMLAERVSGLARIVRANAVAAWENVPLWHERDITHSSVERIIFPDSCILLDYMIAKFTSLMDKLIVYPANMQRNIDMTGGLIFSQRVLLALTEGGMKREDAYKVVQDAAMEVWKARQQGDLSKDFQSLLGQRPELKGILKPKELEALFDQKWYLRNVEQIFKRLKL
jgi:adenylosuccinate lyase